MSDDSCMTCRYWMHIDNHADFPDEPLAHWGICRRYPPAVGHADESAYGFNSDTPGGWPITDGSDWCGEHGGPDDTTPKYIRHDLHDAAIEALEARAEKAEAALRAALDVIEDVQTYEQPDDPWTENALTMRELDVFSFDVPAARAALKESDE